MRCLCCPLLFSDEDEERDGFQHRKLYPQRHNRTKLNYRDLERGMYEEIRQNIWNQGNPLPSSKFDRHGADETQPVDPDLSDLSNESLVTLTSQTVKRESSKNRLSNSGSKIFDYPTSSADASAVSLFSRGVDHWTCFRRVQAIAIFPIVRIAGNQTQLTVQSDVFVIM